MSNIEELFEQIADESERFKIILECIAQNIKTREEYNRLVLLLSQAKENEKK